MKDPKSPATTSLAYDRMLPLWMKVQTVLDGTEAMRAAGQTYLPQHPEESTEAYDDRRQRATLFNLTKITQHSLVGRPFSDPLKFDEDVPQQLLDLFKDVDLTGTDIHVFARNWFADGLAKAYSHVYVDFPRTRTEGVRTLADDREEGVRPYLVHIAPEQLIFADAETVDGREVLREIRIKEEVQERDGFAEVVVPQIRQVALELEVNEETGEATNVSVVRLYRLADEKKAGTDEEEWEEVESFTYDLDFIPLVTFYADRDGFLLGTPPLGDLADLNIAHWQSTSEQRAVLTVARFPILALSGGAPEGGKLVVGPNQWLHSPDAQGKFYYVEHSGQAIEAGRKDLMDLESQMSEYGAEFLKKRPGGMTATARALDSAEATSPLQDMTLRFGHALDQAIAYMGAWLKLDKTGGVQMPTDFGPEEVNDAEMTTLRETRKGRDMSRKAYLGELMRRGVLSEDYSIDEDAEELEKEAMDLFGGPLPEEEEPVKKTEEEEPEEEEE